jgi:Asp-tRNA(Asn)/Glu-tRNA(Gln) amidotransferase A subunit family amidase
VPVAPRSDTESRDSGASRRQPARHCDPFEKSIRELQTDLAYGLTTSLELVRFYLRRIAALDLAGPRLNAILALNPRAEAVAAALDTERRRGRTRGPLHGIPALVEANLDTADMACAELCFAPSRRVGRDEAYQVRRLREAGAVILGVSRPESPPASATIRPADAHTVNPYRMSRARIWGSNGSCVGASANFAAFALGADTRGSVRVHASHNAVVSLRPTLGLSSRSGLMPFRRTRDSVGPIARNVGDVALVLDATVGHDPDDPVTAASAGNTPASYASSLREDALRGARIGVIAELCGSAPEERLVAAVIRRAIGDMKGRGAIVVDVAVPNLDALVVAADTLTPEPRAHRGDALSLTLAAANDDCEQLIQARDALRHAIVEVMDVSRLDALVYPTARRATAGGGLEHFESNAAVAALSGCPAISLPAGLEEVPVGMELLGRPFAEPLLFALAFSYEQATHRRRPPSSAARLMADR